MKNKLKCYEIKFLKNYEKINSNVNVLLFNICFFVHDLKSNNLINSYGFKK
jgi:hypothetical protein